MKTFVRSFVAILLLAIASSCTHVHAQVRPDTLPAFMVWDTQASFGTTMTDEEIGRYLKRFADHNVTGMFLRATNEFYQRIAPIARASGMQLHAWRPTMIHPDSAFMAAHKHWYAVNKDNESCADTPPYVGYYRWFCPSEPEVARYLVNEYAALARIDGLAGIHLDYIRYCDLYLPVGLQPQYNLVQDHEMPAYDYCYCSRCRDGFRAEYGRDPMDIPAADSMGRQQWLEWRLERIVRIVNTIARIIHAHTGKYVTAAVFPTPAMSVTMVRQDWSKFEVDAVCPMLYNNFYKEDVDWIGECVQEGIATMEYRKALHAGIMVHDVMEPHLFKRAIRTALDNGANGVVFFAAGALTDEQLRIVRTYR